MVSTLFLANLFIALVFLATLPLLPPEIPLFYSYPSAEEQLAPLVFIFLPLLLVDFFIILNYFLVKKFFSNHREFNKLLSYTSYFLLAAAIFMIVKTIFLVI